MLWPRATVGIGAIAYVIGGWAGWMKGPGPGWAYFRAHELAGVVGEWAWLGVAPMLGAAVAPFTRRWLRWLWLSAVPPLLYAGWAWLYGVNGSAPNYPFYPLPEGPSWGVGVSFLAAAVVLVALVTALALSSTGREQQSSYHPLAFVAVVALVFPAVVVLRGSRDEAAEQHVRSERLREIQRQRRGDEAIRLRVQCRDRLGRPPQCAWEIDRGKGERGGGASF